MRSTLDILREWLLRLKSDQARRFQTSTDEHEFTYALEDAIRSLEIPIAPLVTPDVQVAPFTALDVEMAITGGLSTRQHAILRWLVAHLRHAEARGDHGTGGGK